MSVFTHVSFPELRAFLRDYPLGSVLGFQGIGEGVENSNFFVDTIEGRWVLTLFERLDRTDLPFFLGLMDHLADRGIPCPRPLKTRDGRTLAELNGKPAAIVNRLTGQSVLFPTAAHCGSVGALLSDMHLAAGDFEGQCKNSRGSQWRKDTARQLLEVVDAGTARLLRDELDAQDKFEMSALPRGITHADLFRDNVLFIEERLSGVIDFYYACTDAHLYDLAVTVNDWCFDPDGTLDRARLDSLIGAYRQRREFSALERGAWPLVLRIAALRFFLSRLFDWHFPRGGDVVHVKDPAEYRRILEHHRTHRLSI